MPVITSGGNTVVVTTQERAPSITAPTGLRGPVGPKGDTGSPGIPGDDGTSIVYKGTVANIPALPANLTTANTGWSYVTADSGHLWIWSGNAFQDAGLMRGPAGPQGPQGQWLSLTQAEYEALDPKNPETLYVIVG